MRNLAGKQLDALDLIPSTHSARKYSICYCRRKGITHLIQPGTLQATIVTCLQYMPVGAMVA